MLRQHTYTILGYLILGLAAIAAGQSNTQSLIETDQELLEFCQKAERLIGEGDYKPALEIFQSILDRGDSGYIAGEGGLFSPLDEWINEQIAALPDDGRMLYRQLYATQAQREFRRAIAEGDLALLRSVTIRYRHTRWGAQALGALAQQAFDAGRFSEAAQRWGRLLTVAPEDDKPRLMVQIASASHLAGLPSQAQATRGLLAETYPDAQLILAGRSQSALAFVDTMLARDVASAARPVLTDWPGQGATGGGAICMPTPEMPDVAYWSWPGSDSNDAIVPFRFIKVEGTNNYYYDSGEQPVYGMDMLDGQVVSIRTQPAPETVIATLPGYVHPVVWGQTLVIRSQEGIVACDLLTGDLRWLDNFPAEVKLNTSDYYYGYYYGDDGSNRPAVAAYDSGHYQPVVGGDTLYVIGGYADGSTAVTSLMSQMQGNGAGIGVRTTLRAYGLADGALRWSSASLVADDAVLGGTTFISPPAYAEGKVYVIGIYARAYWLNCFDAETGQLAWRRHLSHMPEYQNYWYDSTFLGLLARASAPTVVDGQVFALTNVGTISAFDSHTGQALWAYQYASTLNPVNSSMPTTPYRKDNQPGATNPVVVTNGRVVFMPTDASNVFCLDAQTGEKLWGMQNRGQHHLVALDAQRIMLSRPDLVVLSLANGQPVMEMGASDIYGRPALTAEGAILSGRGQFYRLRLDDELTRESVVSVPVSYDMPLGNLVVAGSWIISANVLGVHALVNFEALDVELTDRLAEATDDERPGLLYQRGELALRSGRYDDAYGDLMACHNQGGVAVVEGAETVALETLIHYAIIGQACRMEVPTEKLARFVDAHSWARGEAQLAENLLRQIKCAEAAGDYALAVERAHELLSAHGELDIVDVSVGPDTVVLAPLTDVSIRVLVEDLIQRGFLERLIAVHGQEVYAAFDAQAKVWMDQAIASSDILALLELSEHWPNSQWVDDAMFAAARLYYSQGLAATRQARREELILQAVGVLSQLAHQEDAPLAASAQIVIAAIYKQLDQDDIVDASIAESLRLAERNGLVISEVVVDFADIHGTLGELAAGLRGEAPTGDTPSTSEEERNLTFPVEEAFAAATIPGRILRDSTGQVLTVDDAIFLLGQGRLARLDTRADSEEAAVVWLIGPESDYLIASPTVAGLSPAGDVLVLADDTQAVGIVAATGERVWGQATKSLAGGELASMAAVEGQLLTMCVRGRLRQIDIATGRATWRVETDIPPADATITAWGDWVLVRSADGQRAVCISTQETNEQVTFTLAADAMLAPMGDDHVVVLQDNELAAWELGRQPAGVAWTRAFPARAATSILRAGPDGVVVGMRGSTGSRLEVLGVDGETLGRVQTRPYDGQPAWAEAAYLNAGMLYIICSDDTGVAEARSVISFNLSQGRQLWQSPFVPISAQGKVALPPQLTGRYLLTGFGDGGKLFAMERRTGQWVADVRIGSVADEAIVLGDRLIVPTAQGVVVYASKP